MPKFTFDQLTDTGWVNIAPVGSHWTAATTPWNGIGTMYTPGIRILNGTAYLRGALVCNATTSSGDPVFTSSWSGPNTQVQLSVSLLGATAQNAALIGWGGAMSIYNNVSFGAGVFLGLDGLQFLAS